MSYKLFDNLPTILYNTHMKAKTLTFIQDTTKRISIREYLRNYKAYNKEVNLTGEKIIITNQDNDEVVLSPVDTSPKKRKWTIEDFEGCFFKGGKNLSKNVDKIVYGI